MLGGPENRANFVSAAHGGPGRVYPSAATQQTVTGWSGTASPVKEGDFATQLPGLVTVAPTSSA